MEELNSGEDGRWKRENGGQAEIETKKKKRKKWKVFRECCKSAGWERPTLVSGHLWHSHLNRLLQHLHWGQWGKTDGKQSEYRREKKFPFSFNQAANIGFLPDPRLGQWVGNNWAECGQLFLNVIAQAKRKHDRKMFVFAVSVMADYSIPFIIALNFTVMMRLLHLLIARQHLNVKLRSCLNQLLSKI